MIVFLENGEIFCKIHRLNTTTRFLPWFHKGIYLLAISHPSPTGCPPQADLVDFHRLFQEIGAKKFCREGNFRGIFYVMRQIFGSV